MPRKQSRSAHPAHHDPRFAAYEARNIRALASQRAYNAGRRLMREGRISQGKLRGQQLEALFPDASWWGQSEIRATAVLPLPGEIFDTSVKVSCTCLDEPPCQHVVALLLAWVERNDTITEVPTVAEQLAGRTFDELVAIIAEMVDTDPDLESLIALPPPVPGRPANVPSLDPGMVRARISGAIAQLDISPSSWIAPDYGEMDRLIELSREYGNANLWADAVQILRELTSQTIATGQGTLNSEFFRRVFVECDAGLAICLTRQAELPESDRLDTDQRSGLIRAIYDLWRHDVAGLYALEIATYGPSAIALHATAAERVMVDQWLHTEPVTNPNQHEAITDFQTTLYSVENLDHEELLAQYRQAELWDKVAMSLLKLGRIEEAIATAKRHLTSTGEMTLFAAELSQVNDRSYLGRAITLIEDHAWEIEGRNADDDHRAETWLAYHYTMAGRAAEALPLADKWFARVPGPDAWRCVREASHLPGQPEDAWTTRRQAMEAMLIANQQWWDLAFIRTDDLRIDEALDAFAQVQAQLAEDPYLYDGDEMYALAVAIGEARERADPDGMIVLYQQAAGDHIKQRNRDSYRQAAQILARVRHMLEQHDRGAEWPEMIRQIREQHRSLRAFHEELVALDL